MSEPMSDIRTRIMKLVEDLAADCDGSLQEAVDALKQALLRELLPKVDVFENSRRRRTRWGDRRGLLRGAWHRLVAHPGGANDSAGSFEGDR